MALKDGLLRIPFQWGNALLPPTVLYDAIMDANSVIDDIVTHLPDEAVTDASKNVNWSGSVVSLSPIGEDVDNYESEITEDMESLAISNEAGNGILHDVLHDSDSDDGMLEKEDSTIPEFEPIQEPLRVDTTLLAAAVSAPESQSFLFPSFSAYHSPVPSARGLFFRRDDIARLVDSSQMLNDECINHCGRLLSMYFKTHAQESRRTALFGSFAYTVHRSQADNAALSRQISKLDYPRCRTWFIPIHLQKHSHWIACIVYPSLNRIDIFDSLANNHWWENEIKVCIFTVQMSLTNTLSV